MASKFCGNIEKYGVMLRKEKRLETLAAGGEGGIRTRVQVLPETRFPGVRLKPLIHLSERARRINQNRYVCNLKVILPFP